MKRALVFVAALLLSIPFLRAQGSGGHGKEEIHWITNFDELQQKMKEHPKKVLVDVYTDWCGWCKHMDATTYQNPDLIKYINLNYYAVRFNAERQDVIHFNGKEYGYMPQNKMNALALEWLGGSGKQIGFPTSIFMLENFQNPNPIGGFLTVAQIEPIATFFGDNMYRHQSWDAYQKTYKPVWDHGVAADNTPPPGH